MTRGCWVRNPSTAGPDRTRQRRVPRRDDIGDRRLPEQDRDLAEELAATDPGALGAVDHDGGLALEDDVESGPGHALAEDPLAGRVDDLLERVDDPLQLRIGEVREQAEAGDGVDQGVTSSHGSSLPCQPATTTIRTPPSYASAVRLTALPRTAQHEPASSRARSGTPSEARMTLSHDRRTELLSAARLFDGVDAAGMARLAAVVVEVDFAAGPRHRPAGRHRQRPVRHHVGRRPGRPRRPDRSRSSDPATSSANCPSWTAGRGRPRSSPPAHDLPGPVDLGLRGGRARGAVGRAGDPARPRRPAARPDRGGTALSRGGGRTR